MQEPFVGDALSVAGTKRGAVFGVAATGLVAAAAASRACGAEFVLHRSAPPSAKLRGNPREAGRGRSTGVGECGCADGGGAYRLPPGERAAPGVTETDLGTRGLPARECVSIVNVALGACRAPAEGEVPYNTGGMMARAALTPGEPKESGEAMRCAIQCDRRSGIATMSDMRKFPSPWFQATGLRRGRIS